MGIDILIISIESGAISLAGINTCLRENNLPQELRFHTREIVDRTGSAENAAYLIATIEFYDDHDEAFEKLLESLPKHGDWWQSFDFRQFYYGQKEAYQRRVKSQTPNDTSILECALHFSESVF